MDRDHKCGTPAANDGWLLQHFFDGGHGLVAYPMDCFDGRADPLVAHLRKIPKSKIGTASIRVANSGLTRARAQRIARELVRLRTGKAWVKVMHTAGSGREVREILDQGGVTHLDTQDCPSTEKDTAFNHAKMVLTSWVGMDGKPVYRSWIGSDNMGSASMYSDELMVQLPKKTHYDDYVAFFDDVWEKEDKDPGQCRPG